MAISNYLKLLYMVLILIDQQIVNRYVKGEMIFEMKLLEFSNPLNKTYSNKNCGPTIDRSVELALNKNKNENIADCKVGFLFCLVDLPFRNPQNCSLGDFVTPVLGSNYILFNQSSSLTYKFSIKKLPSKGIGMMIEVRDHYQNDKWQPLDFYTSALADVPLSIHSQLNSTIFSVTKRFSSLFNHNSSLVVKSKLYCASNYFGSNCDVFCDNTIPNINYTCDFETGAKICKDGFTGDDCLSFYDLKCKANVCSSIPCLNDGKCETVDGIFYTCKCKPDYEGQNCEKEVYKSSLENPCFSMPCFNSGKCNIKKDKFECECQPGFYGTYCEADLRRCTSSLCAKGCKCIEVPFNMSFECKCEQDNLKISKKNNMLDQSVNSKLSVPETKLPLLSRTNYEKSLNEYHQSILNKQTLPYSPFRSDNKEFEVKKAKSNPPIYTIELELSSKIISNFSKTNLNSTTARTNTKNSTNSTQLIEYGENLSQLNLILKNSSVTKAKYDYDIISSTEYVENSISSRDQNSIPLSNKKNSLKILNTPATNLSKQSSSNELYDLSFASQEILQINSKKPCYDFNPCKHGICMVNNQTSEFMCECNVGYMGPFCDLIRHPCDFKPCENGICEIVGDLYYKCLCKPNYTGVNCHIEIKTCDSNTCLNGGKCKSSQNLVIGNSDSDFGGCDCPANFTGTYCENQIINQNLCEPNPCLNNGTCNAKLINYQPIFDCTCSQNFQGKICEKTREVRIKNESCLNGGKLIEMDKNVITDSVDKNIQCICPIGFNGSRCENDINECLTIKQPCKHSNMTCINKKGSFECLCPTGLDCNQNTTNICSSLSTNPCQNNSTCSFNETKNEVLCLCLTGFDGKYCEYKNKSKAENSCIDKACLNDAECVNEPSHKNGYICKCKTGFIGEFCNETLPLKKIQILPHTCEMSNPCLNHGKCIKKINKTLPPNLVPQPVLDYYCLCNNGYTGVNCETEIDGCSIGSPCKNGATCQRRAQGSFFCECPLGFHGNLCDMDVDVCEFGVCRNNGTCIDGIGANFSCICEPGYTGKSCQFEIKTCNSKNICSQNGICVNETIGSSYKCICNKGFTGINCEIDIKDKVIEEKKERKKEKKKGKVGIKAQTLEDTCIEYCSNNSTCKIAGGKPFCVCASGLFGERCEKSVKPFCENKQCNNGGSCVFNVLTKITECVCLRGYSGEICEIRNICKTPSKISCYNNGTCLYSGSNNQEHCECATGFSGDNCELSLRISSNESSVLDVQSTLSAIDALSAPASSNGETNANTNQQDNGVWLIVIVFGYIFGLFLIFVIIWFIWYGTSLKRRQNVSSVRRHSHNNHHYAAHRNNSSLSQQTQHLENNAISNNQYDYSEQTSLRRVKTPNHANNQDNSSLPLSSYSPMAVRTNPAFINRDEISLLYQHQQASLSHSNLLNQGGQINQYADDLSSSHSTSFVHSYQHRI